MINFLLQHQFWTAVAIYWIFSAAVSSLPEPAANAQAGYFWLYRFLHSIAGNITTAFGNRIPGLKAIVPVLLLSALALPLQACAAHYAVHPGALNTVDSAAYDTLLVAKAAIDAARADHQSSPELNTLVASYNVARESWLSYRAALSTNVPSDLYFQQLTTNLTDLLTSIQALRGKENQ